MKELIIDKELSFEEIRSIRKFIYKTVSGMNNASNNRLKLSDLDCSKEILDKIIFNYNYVDGSKENKFKVFCLELNKDKIRKKIDFDGIDFSDFYFNYDDLSGTKGIKINPQTVYGKMLSNIVCRDVEFIGSFDGVYVSGTDFTGSKNAKINPQTIYKKNLSRTKCADVEFIGSFDGVNIENANFSGSKNAKINPQTIYDKNLFGVKCASVEFIGPFDGVNIENTNFNGSKNAIINPQTVASKNLSGAKFSNVEFIGTFDGTNIENADFTGSKGVKIHTLFDLEKVEDRDTDFIVSFDKYLDDDKVSFKDLNIKYKNTYENIMRSIRKIRKINGGK